MLLLAGTMRAQVGKTIVLEGADILNSNQGFTLSHSGVQGMDVWGNYLVSLQAGGTAWIYNFSGTGISLIGSLSLASAGSNNHSNLASFSNQFYATGDKLPLLYITRANGTVDADGMSNVAFVERINPDNLTTTLVQKICFTGINGAGQYIIDRQNNFLYVWGNTIGNGATGNKHYVRKFKIPAVGAGQADKVWLNESDALESYNWEDYYTGGANPVIQGGAVKDNLMYLPCGYDSEGYPSVLYVWDLKNRKMLKELTLTGLFVGELEDCSVNYDNELVIQANSDHIYMISLDNVYNW